MKPNTSEIRTQHTDYKQIDERIRAILAEYRSKCKQSNIFITPNIPQKLLNNAVASYAHLGEDERVLIVIEMSHSGSAAGIVLTDKKIHLRSSQGEQTCFELTGVRCIRLQGKELFINNLSTVTIPDHFQKTLKLFPEIVKRITSKPESSQSLHHQKYEKPGQVDRKIQQIADIQQQVQRAFVIGVTLVCISILGGVSYAWWSRPSPPPPESEIEAIAAKFTNRGTLWQQSYLSWIGCETEIGAQVENVENRNNVEEFKMFPGHSKYFVTLAYTATVTCTTRKKATRWYKVERDYLLVDHPPVFFSQDAKGKWGALPLKYYYKPEVLKNVKSLERAIMTRVNEDSIKAPLESFLTFLLFAGEQEEHDSEESAWRENEKYADRIYVKHNQNGRWYIQ